MTNSKAAAWSILVRSLCSLLEDSGIEEEDVLPTSTSAELGVTSIEAMHLLIMVEEETGWELNFQFLLDANGEYPLDLTIGNLFDRIWGMSPAASSQGAADSGN